MIEDPGPTLRDRSAERAVEHGEDPTPLKALPGIVLHPDRFFTDLPTVAGIARSSAFALACIAVSTVMAWLATGADESFGAGVVLPFLFDLVFFAAYVAVTQVLVVLLARRTQVGAGATFRIAAFTQISQLVNWVPVVGLAVGFVYGSVLAVLGIRRLHRTSVASATAVVVLPVLVAAAVVVPVLLTR